MSLFYFVKNKPIGERSIQRHVKNNKSFYSDSPVGYNIMSPAVLSSSNGMHHTHYIIILHIKLH